MTARCRCSHQRATHENDTGRCWWACGCSAYRSVNNPPADVEPRCPRSDLPVSMCAHCRGHQS